MGGHTYRRGLWKRGRVAAVAIVGAGLLVSAACTAAPAAASHTADTAHSTLDGLSTLPQRIHWSVTPGTPTSNVSEVDFLIDGNVGWIEKETPYFYGDDGNWLVTSFLPAGSHVFTAKVILTSGATESDTVTATTTAPAAPPASLAGTWSRDVTAADYTAAGVSDATADQTGTWRYTFAPQGLVGHDPTDGGGMSDVQYPSAGTLVLSATIEHPPYPSPNNGGFCSDTDPLTTWTYTVSADGTKLTLAPQTSDPCPGRTGVFHGVWTKAPLDPDLARLTSQ